METGNAGIRFEQGNTVAANAFTENAKYCTRMATDLEELIGHYKGDSPFVVQQRIFLRSWADHWTLQAANFNALAAKRLTVDSLTIADLYSVGALVPTVAPVNVGVNAPYCVIPMPGTFGTTDGIRPRTAA